MTFRSLYLLFVASFVFIGSLAYWYMQRPADLIELRVAAGPRGGDAHTLMSEVAELVEKHSDLIRLEVAQTTNSSVNIARLHDNRADLAVVEANTPAYSNIQLVADLYSDYFLFIAHAYRGAPLKDILDLPGHRIAIPEEGSSGSRSFWSVIDHYGVAPERFRAPSVRRHKATELFIKGAVDGVFLVTSLRDPFVLAFIAELDRRRIATRFLPIDQADAMALKRPFLKSATVVRGALDGANPVPREDVRTVRLQRLLLAREDTPPAAITELLKIIFDNRLDLLIRMPLSAAISSSAAKDGAHLALHEGARSFYERDKPNFLQENAEPITLLVTLAAMFVSGMVALRRSLLSRAKNRVDVYNEQLLDIAAKLRETDAPADLDVMRLELAELLERVVHALDTDKVTGQGFQSFSFLWTAVRDALDDRERKLGKTMRA